ncbi:MAG: hypothetical protein HQL45_16945, partial [Alphaproteobacteria bacterium]|nr:hypothetical protein [Alphaproteobacteria bacterium]
MTDTLVQRTRAHIKQNEKPLDFPYPDGKGKITAGAGFLMDDRSSFMKQPWEIRDKSGTRPASEAEKAAGWQALQKAGAEQKEGANKRAETFEKTTPLRLPEGEIDAQLNQKVEAHMKAAQKEVGDVAWNKLTDGQKVALTDIHYARGSLSDFERLKRHASNGNEKGMTEEAGFHSGKNSDDTLQRNWDRERRNHAAILGIDPESKEAWQGIAEKYSGAKNLPDSYRQHLPKSEEPKPTE